MNDKLFWVLVIAVPALLIVSFFACSKDTSGGDDDEGGDDTVKNVDDNWDDDGDDGWDDDTGCKSLDSHHKCGDNWWDDDRTDDTWSDDTGDDSADDTEDDTADDTADDTSDDTVSLDCAAGLSVVYNDCHLALVDTDGNPISYDDAVAACEEGDAIAVCTAACGLAATDCSDVGTCFADNCAGKSRSE